MLIDWVTARIPTDLLSDEARSASTRLGHRMTVWDPATGEEIFTAPRWESIRSDSHQISAKAGTDLYIQGSPARLIGDGCNVFSAGASAALDIVGCMSRMVSFVSDHLGCDLPDPHAWTVTRVDVTGNLALSDAAEVRQALAILRECEGGRYRVSQQAGDSVYWSSTSSVRSGKAYAKGPHLQYMMRKRNTLQKQYTQTEITQASKLLRLELSLKRHFFRDMDKKWYQLTSDDLTSEWNKFFSRMIGTAEMKDNQSVYDRLIAVAPTEGQARAALATWSLIQSSGWQFAKDNVARPTYFRHLKLLRQAGLGDADISTGTVQPLRRRVLDAQLVTSWQELKSA